MKRLAAMPELARLTDLRLLEHGWIDPNRVAGAVPLSVRQWAEVSRPQRV